MRSQNLSPGRLEAFSDGVIAVIITIMVLELHAPHDASLPALAGELPVFLSYVVSFVYVAIYWNNHHHFFHLVKEVNGTLLWANLHLLFWLSLVPFSTSWLGEHHDAPIPTAVYGVSLLMPAIAWTILQTVIIRMQAGRSGRDASALGRAIGNDAKGKLSIVFYLTGIGLSFAAAWAADAMYVLVALMWLVPDKRIENFVRELREE